MQSSSWALTNSQNISVCARFLKPSRLEVRNEGGQTELPDVARFMLCSLALLVPSQPLLALHEEALIGCTMGVFEGAFETPMVANQAELQLRCQNELGNTNWERPLEGALLESELFDSLLPFHSFSD